MSVVHVWVGATTDTAAWVRGKVTGVSTRLAVSLSADLSAPIYYGPDAPTADGMVSLEATGLTANTRYYYALEDDSVLDTGFSGTFLTHPVAAGERASFIIGAAGDAGLTGAGDDSYITSAVSDNPVFDTMRTQALAEDWLFFAHLGDMHYRNIATADSALYRAAYDDSLTFNGTLGADARQGRFYRDTALAYVWDDHDFGPNNSDSTAAGNANANAVYRERVPHYTLPAADAIYQSWQVGRVLFIASDVRSIRDPNSDPQAPTKTMLGSAQKTWMENLLASTSAEALVWITPSRWLADGTGTDTWNSFLHERDELIDMFGDLGWLDRMIQLTADMHSLSISSGPGNPWGAFPIYMLASMDSDFGSTDPLYDIGSTPGRQQYGTIAVQDNGHTIALTGTGYINGTVWRAHTAYVHVGNPVWSLDGQSAGRGDIVNPFSPVLDDQGLRNDVTANRIDGGEAQVTDPVHIAAHGLKDDDVTLNVASDEQLPSQAGWRVHQGTWPGMRYPAVSPAINVRPELAEQWLNTELGDLGEITGLPPQHPADTVQLIAEGYTETFRPSRWDVKINTSPGGLWTIAQLATDATTAGPNAPNRADTSGSELAAAAGAVDTEIIVHTPPDETFDRMPWAPTAGPGDQFPDEVPFDLKLGGEVVRATAIKPLAYDNYNRSETDTWGTSTSGHTWTDTGGAASDRSVDGAAGIITLAASPDTIRFQSVDETVADCEVLVRLSVDQVATGASMLPSILLRHQDNSNYYRARLHFGTSGTMFVSITRDTTAIGSTEALPYTYGPGDVFWLRARLIGHRVLVRAWPTSALEPVRWHNDQTITTDPIATGAVGVTGSAFSGNTNVNPQISYDAWHIRTPQRITATRSVNTVAKAHPAGTPVSLAQPARLAL
jgi:hypothetical protein